MPKLYDNQVKQRIRELAETGLAATEITQRLNDGAAGLEKPVPVKYRRVRELVADWEAEHGPPKGPSEEEIALNTAERLYTRALALMQREVAHLEQKRPGSISAEQSRTLRSHVDTVASIRQKMAGDQRRRNGKRPQGASGLTSGREDSSALGRLLEQMKEASTAPLKPDPIPTPTKKDTEDVGAARASGQSGSDEGRNDGVQAGLSSSEPPTNGPSTSGLGWPE